MPPLAAAGDRARAVHQRPAMTTSLPNSSQAQTLIDSVERILESPEVIAAYVDRVKAAGLTSDTAVASRIIERYSNRSAVYGGATALPGLLPGGGTLLVAAAGALADVTLVLKTEVEMCMALSYARGYDIRKREERQLAFLLASIKTHEASTGRNVLLDAGEISFTAVARYGSREIGKVLLKVLGIFLLAYGAQVVGRSILRAIPLIGIGVSAGVNKVLTTRVGELADRELALRGKLG